MFPTTPLQKNLKFPEVSLNFALNLFYKHFNLVNILHPCDFNSSSNQSLVNIIDPCTETRNKISFIPIDFLSNYLTKNGIDITNNFSTKLEKKQFYITLLKKHVTLDKGFFNLTYKNIPLYYLRKPYLSADLTKTADYCRLQEDIKTIEPITGLPLINPEKDIVRNTNEWMSKKDLENIIEPKLLELDEKLQKQIAFKGLCVISNTKNLPRDFLVSQLLNSFNWNLHNNERFICFFILYKSHFTSVIVDRFAISNNNHKTSFAYFFNSCGYNPNHFELNSDFWFIDSSIKFIRHKHIFYKKNTDNLLPIEALTIVLRKKYKINNFVFNSFCIQNFDSECGTFSSMFLYLFLDFIKTRNLNQILASDFSFLYFNLMTLGCDLTYSFFRGLFYMTIEDLENNNINRKIYMSSPDIYEISNHKFKQYLKLWTKGINNITKMYSRLKNDKLIQYNK